MAALLGIAAMAAALAVYRPRLVLPWVLRALTPRSGTASLADLRLSLAPPSLELSGLVIAGPPREGDLLRVDHLRFELIPRRFFLGGPWLRHVEARGLVFERPKPRETKGPPDLTPLTRLFDIEDLALSDARLRLGLPQGELAAEGIRLSLIPAEGGVRAFRGDGKVTFRRKGGAVAEGTLVARGNVTPGPAIEADLGLAPARLALPRISGDLFGRTRVRLTRERIHAEELMLALTGGSVTLDPEAKKRLEPIRLNAAASMTLEGREPRLELRGLDIGGLLLARGRLEGPTPEELSGSLEGEFPRVESLKDVLAPLLPGSLKGMDLAGRLPCRLRLFPRGRSRVLALELSPRDLNFSWPNAGLGGRFGGSVLAEGPFEDWFHGKASLAGRIVGSGKFERPPVGVRLFRFDAPLAGAIAAPASPGWKISVGADEVTYEGQPLPLGKVVLEGRAGPAGNSYRVEGVVIRSDSLGRLTGELAFPAGKPGGRLEGAGLPADNLVFLAGALSGKEWKGWSPAGTIDVSAQLTPASGGSRLTASSTLARIGFTSPSGHVMAQNLSCRADVEVLLIPQPRMKADLVLLRGEALWGTVYIDFAKEPLDLHAGGTKAGPGDYKDLALEGGLAGFGRLTIEGKARRAGDTWRHQGRLVLADARLGPIFRTFLRDPLAAEHRDLAGLEMDGAAGVDLSFSGSGRSADLAGRLRLRSGGIRRGEEPPVLSGLDIDLPLAYSLGAANPGHARPSDPARWGWLRLKKLRFSGQELGPLEMPAVLVPNRLYLGGTIDASPFGAALSLRRIQVDEPLSTDFRIQMAAQLGGLDLARVAGDHSMVEGRLGGILDPVAIGRARITASGELAGELFGGRLDIRRVTVERPFGAGREIGADVKVSLIDLERLSAALGAGRITGRLSGSIEGLRVAYGQPVAFHLRMEPVPVKGVDQSVSLKAVNSISLVSTGSALSGLGVSLMTTFFREFPYEKIGFECRLNNDVFRVRGLIHEDGVEYLVKRRLFGIDVINRNPDNRIGFSDMVERTKRVTAERSD